MSEAGPPPGSNADGRDGSDPFADLDELPTIGLPPPPSTNNEIINGESRSVLPRRQRLSSPVDTTSRQQGALEDDEADILQPTNGAEDYLDPDGSSRYYYLTLPRALWNEKSAPDLLEYETDAMDHVHAWLQQRVRVLRMCQVAFWKKRALTPMILVWAQIAQRDCRQRCIQF